MQRVTFYYTFCPSILHILANEKSERKIETSASAFRGRGCTEILQIADACERGREGSDFRGICVDLINGWPLNLKMSGRNVNLRDVKSGNKVSVISLPALCFSKRLKMTFP